MDTEFDPDPPQPTNPNVTIWIFGAIAVLVVAGFIAFSLLRPSATPPPAAIANDPLLVQGRVVYLDRCARCHGELGKGDGPTARGLAGPPVGDLSDSNWKHGDKPDDVLKVLRVGVRDTAMPAWTNIISENSIKAVAAYVYHLAGREVPAELRGN